MLFTSILSALALLFGGVSLSLELTLDDSERRSHSLLDDCELAQSSIVLSPTRTSACFGFFRIDLVGVLDSELISLTCSEAVAAPAASEVTGWSGGEMEGTRSSPLLPLTELELLSGAAAEETAAGAVTFWPPPMKSSRCLWTDDA